MTTAMTFTTRQAIDDGLTDATMAYRLKDGDAVTSGAAAAATMAAICNATAVTLYMGAATLAAAGSLTLAAALAI